jgi:hypothetical protein
MKMFYTKFANDSGSYVGFVFQMQDQHVLMLLPSLMSRDEHFNADSIRDARGCTIGYRSRAGSTVANALSETHFIRSDNFYLEELDKDILHWFRRELPNYFREVLSSFSSGMSYGYGRFNASLNRLMNSCDSRSHNSTYRLSRLSSIDWHQSVFNTNRFIDTRNFYKQLGAVVAEAIKDNDVSAFDDFAMSELRHRRTVRVTRVFDNIKNALEDKSIYSNVIACDCGHLEWEGDTHEVRNDTWCDSCFREDAVYVEDIDEYWHRDDACYHERSDDYRSYDEDDEDDENDPDSLMDYSTNVLEHISADTSINSSPHGDFLMGIEFEMQTAEDRSVDSAVSDVRDQLGSSYCVCKSDGSIGHLGLEIVTAPRGLAEHIKRFKDWNIKSYYRAWDTRCCGLHVHIDSHAFTQMTLGKFIMLINSNANADFIRKIAGRHPFTDNQARDYCSNESQSVLVNPKQALKGKSSSRYRMVNTTCLRPSEAKRLGVEYVGERSFNTIELRIFRASLNKSRLLAQIEFAHACVYFCRVASWRELDRIHFVKWLSTVSSSYPHLADWYGVRRRNTKVTAESQCRDTVDDVESV